MKRAMPRRRATRMALGLLCAAVLLGLPAPGSASTLLLTDLASFAVLGASALTGSLGVSNNSLVTGISGFLGTLANDPGASTGAASQSDPFAIPAGPDLVAATTTLRLPGPGTTPALADVGGLTLRSGVYTMPAATSNLTGTLTLDGLGDATAMWCSGCPAR
jgi:Ice-binding-like